MNGSFYSSINNLQFTILRTFVSFTSLNAVSYLIIFKRVSVFKTLTFSLVEIARRTPRCSRSPLSTEPGRPGAVKKFFSTFASKVFGATISADRLVPFGSKTNILSDKALIALSECRNAVIIFGSFVSTSSEIVKLSGALNSKRLTNFSRRLPVRKPLSRQQLLKLFERSFLHQSNEWRSDGRRKLRRKRRVLCPPSPVLCRRKQACCDVRSKERPHNLNRPLNTCRSTR